MDNKDKQIYNSRICEFCTKKNKCDKNRFSVYVMSSGLTMRCDDYEYIYFQETIE